MGKKKNKSNSQKTNESQNVKENKNKSENEKEKENQKRENGDGEKYNEATRITVVLETSASYDANVPSIGEIKRCVGGFEGVETVKVDTVNVDPETYRVTVVGKVDPMSLRDKLAATFDLRVELIYPKPKKDHKSDQKPEEKANDKNSKEAPLQTAVLKWPRGWQDDKIREEVLKTKGVMDLEIDGRKRLLTVKGTMDVRGLLRRLQSEPRAWTYMTPYPVHVIHPYPYAPYPYAPYPYVPYTHAPYPYVPYPYASYRVEEDPNACSIM